MSTTLVTAALVTGLTVGAPEAAAPRIAPAALTQFDHDADAIRQLLRIPGLSVAIADRDRLLFARAYGDATLDTPLPIASITKTFSAAILLGLAERGRVSLEDPLSRYVPTEPSSATIRHVLSHTADGVPGTRFLYNGALYGQLARVIESAAGRPFGDVLTTDILRPLGMTATTVDAAVSAAAGVRSTPAGLIRYAQALLRGRLASKSARRAMWTPGRFANGDTSPYGLGWFVADVSGAHLVMHFGQEDACSSLLAIDIDRGLVLVALAESSALSEPFWLLFGDLSRSPLVQAFLRCCVAPAAREERTAAGADVSRAFALTSLGRRDEANAIVKSALSRFPDLNRPDPALLAAFARSGDDELRAAGERIGRALLARDPDNARTLFDLGVLYLQWNKPDQARPLFEHLLALPNQRNSLLRRLAIQMLGSH